MGGPATGPRYAVRLGDLGDGHLVRVTCWACGHRAGLEPEALRDRVAERLRRRQYRALPPGDPRLRELADAIRLLTLEPLFACGRCGNREGNSWAVVARAKDGPGDGSAGG